MLQNKLFHTVACTLLGNILCCVCVCVCGKVLGYPKSPALHLVTYVYFLLMEVLQHHRFWLDEDRTAVGVQWFYQQCRKFLAEKFCCLVLQWNACLSFLWWHLCSFVQNSSGMGFIWTNCPFWFQCVFNSMVLYLLPSAVPTCQACKIMKWEQ